MIPLDYKLFYLDSQYNNDRRNMLLKISEKLTQYDFFNNMNYINQSKYLKKFELSCYKKLINKCRIHNIKVNDNNNMFKLYYIDICYPLLISIDKNNNDFDLIENKKFIDSFINKYSKSVDTIANLTIKDYCEDYYNNIQDKLNNKITLEVKYSTIYRCYRCKQYKCTYTNRYNRSFDECVNLTIKCINCGYSWNG
tara:strand:+ start:6337 stop:6924 length:588 start_codon:yes stop_codon:yes gene_type:complete